MLFNINIKKILIFFRTLRDGAFSVEDRVSGKIPKWKEGSKERKGGQRGGEAVSKKQSHQ